MAKRFTETAKWDQDFFSGLSTKMKLVWIYLCDKCDHAGIWDANLKLLSFQISEPVSLEEIKESFGDKLKFFGNKILISPFVEFQYGALNPNNKVHKSVLDKIQKLALIKPLDSSLEGAKEKEEDKEKEMDKEKEEEKGNQNLVLESAELEKTNSVQGFHARFVDSQKENPFLKTLEDWKLKKPILENNLHLVEKTFGTTEKLDEWLEHIVSRPGYQKAKAAGSVASDSYITKALKSEMGLTV